MSATEILVILIGLCVGYWVVSKLISSKAGGQQSQREQAPQESTRNDTNASMAWYETLNVPSQATVEDIRQAYKVLMQQYHPDKVAALGDELKALAERKSKEITNAYREAMRVRGQVP